MPLPRVRFTVRKMEAQTGRVSPVRLAVAAALAGVMIALLHGWAARHGWDERWIILSMPATAGALMLLAPHCPILWTPDPPEPE